jgi:hypothetical protein
VKYVNIKINECDCELLLDALKKNDLSILGEQSTDQIVFELENVFQRDTNIKPSKFIDGIQERMKSCGDKNIYILSKVDGKGTHIGKITGFGADVEDGIIIETDIESESCTK